VHGRHRFRLEHIVQKRGSSLSILRQIRVDEEPSKNLVASTIQIGAGDPLLDYIQVQRRKQKKERTIRLRVYYLEKLLNAGADLSNPVSVETVLAEISLTTSQKFNAVAAYKSYYKVHRILWVDPPKIDYQPKETFVPSPQEINALIHAAGRYFSRFLQVAATTGARGGEICRLQWTDVDFERNTISINNPEKRSNTRTIPVPKKTIAMLTDMPKKYGANIFNPNPNVARDNLVYLRTRLADVQKNPRFRQIHLHTFRHYFARIKLLETHDKAYVQHLLGHKSSASTDRYTKFKEYPLEGKWKSAIAKTEEEALNLTAEGWQVVGNYDGKPMFRRMA
jgi:integrase